MKDVESRFSAEEYRILALQSIQKLNQRIGIIGRSDKNKMAEMKLLQTFVNSLTYGIKNHNVSLIRLGLRQAKYTVNVPRKNL